MIIENRTSKTVGCAVTADPAASFSINRDDALTVAGRLLYSTPGSSIGPYDNLETAYSDLTFLKYRLGVLCHVGTKYGNCPCDDTIHIYIDDDPSSKDVS